MTIAFLATASICGFTLLLHLVAVTIAIVRCRPQAPEPRRNIGSPPVSLIRPVCGVENFVVETLQSGFRLDYPDYEIVFCVADGNDPVVPLVRRLIAQHPNVPARLIIGDVPVSTNPKLNNCIKGWDASRHDWIIIADSNVLMPCDYVQRLLSRWGSKTGLVCSPPIGCQPRGFWAELECAFLNTYQAPWQYAADTLGFGFAQGKTMLWRCADMERGGGIRALGREVAEDAAATKLVRAQGLQVRLVDAPFGQPLGSRTAADVWRRQVRWAQLRRASFPLFFFPEILSGGLFPTLMAGLTAALFGFPMLATMVAFATIWYGAEMLLCYLAGWHVSLRSPLVALIRDLLLPAIWIEGWRGNGFVWRGTPMQLDTGGLPSDSAAPV